MPKTKTKTRSKMNRTSRKNISLQKKLLQRLTPSRKNIAIITVVLFGAVGAILYLQSQAGTCGARKDNYTYQVPWGKAVWNQPVCNLPQHSQSTDYVNRLIEWGHLNDGSPSADVNNGKISTDPGFPKPPTFDNPDGLSDLFTTEVYYASKAGGQERSVSSVTYPSNFDGIGYNPEIRLQKDGAQSQHPKLKMPWNSAWKTSKGGDNQAIVIDDRPTSPTYGAIFSLWQTGIAQCGVDEAAGTLPYPIGGWGTGRLCAGSIQITRDPSGKLIDYRTFEGQTGDRGVGIHYYATLTTADEVKAGEIRHALGISIPNPAAGPECTPDQLKPPVNWGVVGKQCGTAVAPASKFEWKKFNVPDPMPVDFRKIYTQEKLIPEGMRFALKQNVDIEAWIKSRPDLVANPRRAETARIFATALKDYGMMVVDTNGGRPSVQTEGGINPESAEKWKSVAMGPEQKDNLLDGLVTKENLYVIEPPTLTCKDGSTSKFYCDWTKAQYTTTSTDVPVTSTSTSTPPSVTISSPLNNAPVAGPVDIAANVLGQNPVTSVQMSVGSNLLSNDTAAPYTYRFDSKSLSNGSHTISVKATDSKNLSTTKTVTINVNNPTSSTTSDKTPPTPPSTLTRSLRADVTKFRYVLDLGWKASQDSSGIREYQITRTGGSTPFTRTTKELKVTDDTIEAGIPYSYSVVAIDGAGLRSLPSSVSAKGNCFLLWCSLE